MLSSWRHIYAHHLSYIISYINIVHMLSLTNQKGTRVLQLIQTPNLLFIVLWFFLERKMVNLDELPEDCFAHVLSLTSPQDACHLSLVSSLVHSMADLDSVWEKFLPSDYKAIMSTLVTPVMYSTSKELFMRLCTPRLIDGGRKVQISSKYY